MSDVVIDGEHFSVPERMVVSPGAGIFQPVATGAAPGEAAPISIGTIVGHIGSQEVRSLFAGWLMGMLALPGERVRTGQPIAWLRAA